MIRRHFIRLAAMVGVSTFGAVAEAFSTETKTTSYRVEGFSCTACAAGLDVVLGRRKGVVWAKSSYAEKTTQVCFHPDLVTEREIIVAVEDMGFVLRHS